MRAGEEITRAFASGATVLTGNARAARWLRREYGLRQREAGRRAWTTPPIEDWDTWLRRQWEARALADGEAPLLLSSLQERAVWTRMQREDAALVVSPAGMAALAEGAYALLSEYGAHAERNHTWAKADAESFRRWAASFERECARRNWMPRAGLEAKIAASLNADALPEEILLAGFDRVTPAQEGLLRALADCGVRIHFAEMGCEEPRAEFVRAAGLREEIAACAWWARGWVEKNAEARIGILVPDLGAARSGIERVFRRVLMPRTDDIFSEQAMPFEFSLGHPLADSPGIRAALLLLRWLREPLGEEEVSWLLLSGFLGSSSDQYLALARQDARIRARDALSTEIGLEEFLRRTGGSRLSCLARLEDARKAAAANRIEEQDRLPGQWIDLVQLLLREAGWPGAADRGTLHYQALRRWERALDEIALLDFDGQRVGYGDFLRTLEAHARETIFSPESHGAPVQVMGALEASGQQFDTVWFLSADDESWPLRGRAHPLLPSDVQRRFRMPYADAENDLALAKAVTARIAVSAPAVVFSHAERNRDGELRPSTLLPRDAAWRAAEAPDEPMGLRTEPLEEVEDDSGVIAWPVEQSPGGADVLKHQAACPFHAFAAKRLRAEPLNRHEWGLSAAMRGKLLHETLQKIWSPDDGALHSLEELQTAVREGRLDGILTAAIAEAFARLDAQEDAWTRAYLASEQRRLHRRLAEWMRLEAARVPFEVIACEEKLHDVNVGGLKLKLRADRIDEVSNFERLLIDYKTGAVSVRDWEGARPNEPQLPLYAVFGNVEDVRGVLFARIRAGETGFAGSVADLNRQLLPLAKATAALGATAYTDEMRGEWESALLGLAADFLRGAAAVDPKDGKKSCAHCPMPGLCRVAEVCDPLEEGAEAKGDGDDE
ncbi:MAG: PD-(D/E)XK nuclease family protein [Acidobacteriaceae bacterium]